MKKIILFAIFIFTVCAYAAEPAQVLVYNETGIVSLQANATDPDKQPLRYFYSRPLNEQGEWRTTYGDAGIYNVTITVSDGELSASKAVLLVVNKKEERPAIDSYVPRADEIVINEGQNLDFEVKASDLNKDVLGIYWFVNGNYADEGARYSFYTDYSSAGSYAIRALISDGALNTTKEWVVSVIDIDIDAILKGIKDVNITETEDARIKLPNFRKLGLAHSISEPIGNDNYWQTNYSNAGTYYVEIRAEGKAYSGNTTVKVSVNNKDRLPEFNIGGIYNVKEENELKIHLTAADPDGERVTFSAEDLPEGAEISNNTFTWKPGYDFVTKKSQMDGTLDRLHLLYRTKNIRFAAVTKSGFIERDAKILVFENNRQFTLDNFNDTTVNEGETIKLVPVYYEPDNDRLDFSYSGFMGDDTYTTKYGDAGEYYVKVSANDGYNYQYTFAKVIVKKTNRRPFILPVKPVDVLENSTAKIVLNAADQDNDKLTIYIVSAPDGAELIGNTLMWTPPFEFASKNGKSRSVTLVLGVSDGIDYSTQNVTVTVFDKNRAPVINDFSTDTTFQVNRPGLLWVDAEDKDGDQLTYTWEFGVLEKYKATPLMERVFLSTGMKKVKVIVSDGAAYTEQSWNVNSVGNEVVQSRAAPPAKLLNTTPKQPSNLTKAPNASAQNHMPRVVNATAIGMVYTNRVFRLAVGAIDADNDQLRYTWVIGGKTLEAGSSIQAKFLSEGAEQVKVTVSDGKSTDDYVWSIRVTKAEAEQQTAPQAKNIAPEIVGASTLNSAEAGKDIAFWVNAKDNDSLKYTWNIAGKDYSAGNYITAKFGGAGTETVKVTVSDGKLAVQYIWRVNVYASKAAKETSGSNVQPAPYDRYIIEETNGEITYSKAEKFTA